jgi:TonB family protein
MNQTSADQIGTGSDNDSDRGGSFGLIRFCLLFSLVVHAIVLSFDYRRQPRRPVLQQPIVVQIRELTDQDDQPPAVQPKPLQPKPNLDQHRYQQVIVPRPLESASTTSLIRDDGFINPGHAHLDHRPTRGVVNASQNHVPAGVQFSNSETSASGTGITAKPKSIRCISNCNPPYPSALNGAEGNARMLVSINSVGDVTGVVFAGGSNNPALSRLALRAAARMRFSVPDGLGPVTVPVNIFYTIRGTAFDHDTSTRINRVVHEQKRPVEELPPPSQPVPSE